MRRVVVSGMGAVTPLGGDLESTWKNLIANKSGANFVSKFDTTDFQTKISCEVPIKNDDELLDESFDPGDWFASNITIAVPAKNTRNPKKKNHSKKSKAKSSTKIRICTKPVKGRGRCHLHKNKRKGRKRIRKGICGAKLN